MKAAGHSLLHDTTLAATTVAPRWVSTHHFLREAKVGFS